MEKKHNDEGGMVKLVQIYTFAGLAANTALEESYTKEEKVHLEQGESAGVQVRRRYLSASL